MKSITRIGCFFYSALLSYIFFLARRRPSPTFFEYRGYVSLLPFKDKYWYFIHQRGLPPSMVIEFYKDLFGNILLFAPLPFFLLVLTPFRSLKQVLIIAASISLTVEITQFILSIGMADIDDLLLNTLGALIGFYASRWIIKAIARFF